MKRDLIHLLQVFVILLIILISVPVSAQDDAPPPPSEHGLNGDQPRGTPIGGGGIILLGLACSYGVFKVAEGTQATLICHSFSAKLSYI